MTPIVSIIVPTYNSAKFLPLAIQGILSQSHRDFECIIVDDGSTDGTKETVEHFKDDRIRYHRQTHSGLPATARNTGIRLSKGRYIAFLDADDIWYPIKLEKVVSIFQTHLNVGLVCHSENIKRGDEIIGINTYGPFEPDMFKRLLFKGNVLSTSATTVRKEVLEKVGGFDERQDFYCVEDYDLWMRIARERVEFCFLSEVLGEYRIHGSNFSGIGGGDIERSCRNLRSVLAEHFGYVSSPSWSERFMHRRNLANTYYRCGQSFWSRREFSKAPSQYIKAIIVYPLGIPI